MSRYGHRADLGRAISTALVLVFALAAAACAGGEARKSAENSALIAPNEVLLLPAPGTLGRDVAATQLITVKRDGETNVFEGNIRVTAAGLQLIGMDSLGRRAMTIVWSGANRIDAETASWLPSAVKPGPMLADIVLLYWPDDVVRQALPPGAALIDRPGSRSVTLDGKELFHVDYLEGGDAAWSGRLRYRNTAWGYEIDVQSVEVQP